PDVVGKTLTINGVVVTVIGVAPESFVSVTNSPVGIYLPTMLLGVGYRWCDSPLETDCTVLDMIGRLAPGRTVAEASAELSTLLPPAWTRAKKGENSGLEVRPMRGTASNDSDEAQLVRILTGVAAVLLLVCCANLAGLLTAQGGSRSHEFAIRLALG